eukprot:354955-Pleurochrysis_carterae.AAC.1
MRPAPSALAVVGMHAHVMSFARRRRTARGRAEGQTDGTQPYRLATTLKGVAVAALKLPAAGS